MFESLSFIGAIDESGERGNNLEYLSILIGEKDKVESVSKTIPKGFTHMTFLNNRFKKGLLEKFNLRGNIQICCLKFDYSGLESKYKEKSRETNSNKYKKSSITTLR